jgi:putative N6-adenine-specific DNA methylase
MRAEAEEAAIAAQRKPLEPIVCADVAPEALAAARQNAAAASVDDALTFERADVAALQRRWPAGTVVTNPPYGERLKPESLSALYRGMGRAFARLGGWRVVVLSGSPLWTREVRQKPAISHKLFNGPLEVRLLVYDVR